MNQNQRGVVQELYERYPLLKVLALESNGAEAEVNDVPPFLGVLLSIIEQRGTGASCIVLPSRERIAFILSLLDALITLKRSFDDLELDRLTTTFSPGDLVRVAPEDRVFEVVEDGKHAYGTMDSAEEPRRRAGVVSARKPGVPSHAHG